MPKVVLHDVGLLAFLTTSKLACSGPTSDKIVVVVVVVETFVKYYAIHSIIVQIFKWIKYFITEGCKFIQMYFWRENSNFHLFNW